MSGLVVSVPDEELRAALVPLPDGAEAVVWDLVGPPPVGRIDLVVPPYLGDWRERLPAVAAVSPRLVQSQMLGYDGVERWLPPDVPYANAAGVHEASTAELAVGLVLASLRRIDEYVRQAATGGAPSPIRGTSLADRHVLLLGVGGVGAAVARRLAPFEVELTRVARTARTDEHGAVHGMAELPALLPLAEVVILAVPLDASTTGLVDTGFLAALPDGALLVNVGRGPLVDTAALIDATADGRIRAALDVTEPEPLPAGHPLLASPHVLVVPHVGGHSTAMRPRMVALIRRQIALLRAGEPAANVVLGARR
ncbi:NAD(P)-dependent oxidoreductase [uncultured Amnibacterium sp.]|uniref:NAD(P)-dependent oxidoreductase n=1 Tax=uncultured Amnibacterium sp. TaxID=1631851 RepID=UPI0035CA0B27